MLQKKHYELEFPIHSSPQVLFPYIASAAGLSQWFADNVEVEWGETFTFYWDDLPEKAIVICQKFNEKIRFRWLTEDSDDETYFEFRIIVDELTSDVSLVIEDFATDEELEEDKQLWHNSVFHLKRLIGSE